jgi:uncharacterized protein (DUF952 family)
VCTDCRPICCYVQAPAARSDLDKNDGFLHSSNGAMVKKVAGMFFKEVGDALLLKMKPGEWEGVKVTWTTEEPAGKAPPTDGGVLIHYLNDGCAHVFSAEPLPLSAILDTLPMPLGPDGVHVFPDAL